ncbi:hypothetical protein B0J13DRAFT_646635 [Dactylonectria estremocensis]|uniref:Rhodopsin domain-containing protein n=1 Tax=Dactylonectria estremocensis TaxID=1079267 RepID=A0A9P9DVJ3_9HYPO|nr:hypothetical protein B0J13DRAFT_646635 [Dactylonectria estremocensis]
MTARNSYYPTVITFLVVDGVAVGLRFWARGIKRAVGYDDVTMAVSLIGFTIFCVIELQAIDYGIGATTIEEDFDLVKAAMFFTVAQIVYILATGISKLGVGLVLFRLADKSDMLIVRFTLVVSMAIVCVWTLAVALIFALQCRPLSVAWGVGTGTFLSTTVMGNTGIALSVMDMTMSWFYALLPIHMLGKTQLRLKLKISILLLLGLGAVSSIASIVRLKYDILVAQMSSKGGLATTDLIQTTLEATIYSLIEIGLTIFAVSLAALRPLLKRVPCFSDISSGGRSGSHGFAISTFGQSSSRATGPSYRLDDRAASEGGSQEKIVRVKPGTINKQIYIESTSSSRVPGTTAEPVRARW